MPQPPPSRRHSPPVATAARAALPADTLAPVELLVFNKLAFGPTPSDVAAFRALPGADDEARFKTWVERQLNPATIDDAACDARLAAADLSYTATRTQEQLWAEYLVSNKFKGQGDKEWEWRYKPTRDARAATIVRAAGSQRQLFEVLVDFWHNHFSVFPHDFEEIFATWPAYDTGVIRAHALGNFRAMLGGVAQSIAMLRYLDNHVSQDGGPNENYARELLELHTLGAENYLGIRDPATVPRDSAGLATGYVDNDVYEVARCFTGWTYDMDASWLQMTNTGAFVYRKDWHDRFNKLVLGRYFKSDQPDMKDGQDVLTLLARHPGTAHFVCKKLCRRLIADDPPEGVVARAAAVFLKNVDAPDQLRQVVRAIVLSPEFRGAYGAKIKRPFESAISMLRAVNAQFTDTRPFFWHYDLMGQPIFGRHSPDGHPDTRAAWSNTVSILYRWRFAIHLTEGWVKDDDHGFKVDILAETPADKRAPDAALRYWAGRILLRPLPEAHHAAIVATLKGADDSNDSNYGESLTRAVQLILMSPQAQLR